jgi:outer membrane protein assembly factor BamB
MPLIQDDNLYLASNNDKFIKLNLSDGSIIWQSKMSAITSMNLFGNNIFVTNNANQIASVNITNGKVNWLANLGMINKQKKETPMFFLAVQMTYRDKQLILNAITNNGAMYKFPFIDDNHLFSIDPIITKMQKNIQYISSSKSNPYLVTNREIFIMNNK